MIPVARHWSLVAGLTLLASCSSKPSQPDERALTWLFAHQSKDGAWRSEKYNVLQAGRTLTPFILFVLAQAPPERLAPHRDAIARALARSDDAGEEYPTYTRALWILALVGHRPAGWEERVRWLARELRETQMVEALGWTPADPEYGGWDRGVKPPKKPDAERADVSVTAFAIEALRAAGASESDPACVSAKLFAASCQNAAGDGGAYFTPSARWAPHQNKAGADESGRYRPYGTATADALRLMRACGVPEADRRWIRALAWFDDRFTADVAPGFPKGGDRWDEALQFYWLFAAARVGQAAWKPKLRARLAQHQQADGSWTNPQGLMKEDDPLIATGLALSAYWMAR